MRLVLGKLYITSNGAKVKADYPQRFCNVEIEWLIGWSELANSQSSTRLFSHHRNPVDNRLDPADAFVSLRVT